MTIPKWLVITVLIALMLAVAPVPSAWSSQQMECQDYDLTGRMFATSYRTRTEGEVRCVYAGRIEPQCPPVAPNGNVLVKERQHARDSLACFYAPGINGGGGN
jgi:hypothetical protein